ASVCEKLVPIMAIFYVLGCRNNVVIVDSQNNQAAQHIEDGHNRNQLLAYAGNRLDTAENNNRRQDGNHHAYNTGRDTDIFFTYRGNGVYLGRASDSKRSETGKQGKYHAQPLHVQASVQGIHGAALHPSVLCLNTVFY